MKNANVLIVEDEVIIAKDMSLTLTKLGYNVVGHSVSGQDAVHMAAEKRPDVVMMDVMLKGDVNGIEAAKEIKQKHNIPVVFITAYSDEDTLSRTHLSSPFGYLVKPFKATDLRATIETALARFREEDELKKENEILHKLYKHDSDQNILFVKTNAKLIRLKINDILYIEALKDYVNIFTTDNKYMVRTTMKGIQDKLPAERFVRIHRSFIVAVDKVSTIDHATVILENNNCVPLGGLYKEQFLEKLNTV